MLQETIAPANSADRYSGHRKLWGRVIQRAIYDWVTYRDSNDLERKKVAENAESWLFKPSELFNGFETVCIILDIDPDIIRQRAKTFTKEDVLKAEHIERSSRKDDEEEEPVVRKKGATKYIVEW